MADEDIRDSDLPEGGGEGQQEQDKHIYRKVEIRPAYGEERDGIRSEQRKVVYRRLDKSEEEVKNVLGSLSEGFKALNEQVKELTKNLRLFGARISEIGLVGKRVGDLKSVSSEIGNVRKVLRGVVSGATRTVGELRNFTKVLRDNTFYMREFTKSVFGELRKRMSSVGDDLKGFSAAWVDLFEDIEADLSRSIHWVKSMLDKHVVDIGVRYGRSMRSFNQALLSLVDELGERLRSVGMSKFEKLFGAVLIEDLRNAVQRGFVKSVDDVMALWQEIVSTRLKGFNAALQSIHDEIAKKAEEVGGVRIKDIVSSLERQLFKSVSIEKFWRGIFKVAVGSVSGLIRETVSRSLRNLRFGSLVEEIDRIVLGSLLGPLAEPVWEIIGGGYRFGGGILFGRLYESVLEGRRSGRGRLGVRRYYVDEDEEEELWQYELPRFLVRQLLPQEVSEGLVGENIEERKKKDAVVTFASSELIQERGAEMFADKVVLKVAKEAKVVFEDMRGVPMAFGGGGGGWGILDWLGLSAVARSARGMLGRFTGIFGRITPWLLRRFPFLSRLLPRSALLGRIAFPALGFLLSAGLDIYKGGLRGLVFGVREQPWYERGLSGLIKGASLGAVLGSVFPVVGTKLGGVIGGIAGALTHIFGEDIEEILYRWSASLKEGLLGMIKGGVVFWENVWNKLVSFGDQYFITPLKSLFSDFLSNLVKGGFAFWESVWNKLASAGDRYLVSPLKMLFDKFVTELRGVFNFLLDSLKSIWRYGSGFVSSVWEKVVSLFKGSSTVDAEKARKEREYRTNQMRIQRSRGAAGREEPATRREELTKPQQQKERRRGVGALGGMKEGTSLPALGPFMAAHVSADVGNLFIDSMDRFTKEVGNVVGVLAAMSESSVRADVVAPDVGGKAYGMFQIHQGVMKSFLQYLESRSPEIGREFAGIAIGSREFDRVWKEVARKHGSEFAKLQWGFIYESRYLPLLEKASRLGIDINRLGTQEFLFSMAVQHGGAGKILALAQRLASEKYSKEISELGSELQLQILAEARRKYVSGLTHLAPSIRSAVVKRIDREERLALELQRIASQGKEMAEKDVADGMLYQIGEYKPVLSGVLRSFVDILQEDVDLRMEEFMRLKGAMIREQPQLQQTQEGAYAMSVPGVVGVKGIEDIPIAVDDLGVLLVQLGLV